MSDVQPIPAGTTTVKLVGVLGSAAGSREILLPIGNRTTIQHLVSILMKIVDKKFFQDLLVEAGTGDPRPNVIILLNDQDCNVFDGLKTHVEPGSRVTIIPVAHGG